MWLALGLQPPVLSGADFELMRQFWGRSVAPGLCLQQLSAVIAQHDSGLAQKENRLLQKELQIERAGQTLLQLNKRYKQALDSAQADCAATRQAMVQLGARREQLVLQARRLQTQIAKIKQAWPPHSAIYKDKLKQALIQARGLQETIAKIDERAARFHKQHNQADVRLTALQAGRAQKRDQLRRQSVSLNASRAKVAAEREQLHEAERALLPRRELRQFLQTLLTQAEQIIAGWDPGVAASVASFERMRQALTRAEQLAGRVARLEGLLNMLAQRLPRRAQALQNWYLKSKDLDKKAALLAERLQGLMGQLNGDTYPEQCNGQLLYQLTDIKNQLLPLIETRQELLSRAAQLSKPMPQELERGKRWTEAWRAEAKEQRALLTQALAWQQETLKEIEQASQRLRHVRPAWNEQAAHLMLLADLWPALLACGRKVYGKALWLDKQAKLLQAQPIPAPSVLSLVKTPVSFKPWAASWRRLQPGSELSSSVLQSIEYTVDYWQHMLSQRFSDALHKPLKELNVDLQNKLERSERQKAQLTQARGRTARRLWKSHQGLLTQENKLHDLARAIAEIAHELDLARGENKDLTVLLQKSGEEKQEVYERVASLQQEQQNLQEANRAYGQQVARLERDKEYTYDLLQDARQDHEHDQTLIYDLMAKSRAGEEARASVQRLEGVLAHVQNEQKLERQRIAELLSENTILRAHKAKTEQFVHQAKETLENNKLSQKQIQDLTEQNIALRSQQVQNEHLQEIINQFSLREAHYLTRIENLEAVGLNVERLQNSLGLARRTIKALRGKVLERHRLYRQAQQALAGFKQQRERNISLEVKLEHLENRLAISDKELGQLRADYRQAMKDRDEARANLIMERSVRAALTSQGLQQQALQQALEQAREDARYWSGLARELQEALHQAPSHKNEAKRWKKQAAQSAAQVQELQEKLRELGLLLTQAAKPKANGPAAEGQVVISRRQTERLLGSLQETRRKLKHVGRSILHGWLLIAALSGGLILGTPTISGTAGISTATLNSSSAAAKQQPPTTAPGNMPARAGLVQPSVALRMDFRPARVSQAPLPQWMEKHVAELAHEFMLPFESLRMVAENLWLSEERLSVAALQSALRQLAWQTRQALAQSPYISSALEGQDIMPATMQADMGNDRLFNEYCALGFSPAEALGALGSNLRAKQMLRQTLPSPANYRGRMQPIAEVESLSLHEFVEQISPYIESKVASYMSDRGQAFPGSAGRYARDLAADIYCAATAFDVPRTFMLAIAHQESHYANVLGDSSRSSSPFQIFAPTKRVIIQALARQGFVAPPPAIRLERHITMSAYMAAFHLKQLMHRCSASGYVDTERLLRLYNGGETYAGLVAKRQNQLTGFMAASNKAQNKSID